MKKIEECLFCDPPPFALKPSSKTSSQVSGLSYEKRVAKELSALYADTCDVRHGQWLRFRRGHRWYYRQPDVLLIPTAPKAPVIVVECKRSHQPSARGKLQRTYGPAVKVLTGRKVVLVQVCRILSTQEEGLVSLDSLLSLKPKYYLCHWF